MNINIGNKFNIGDKVKYNVNGQICHGIVSEIFFDCTFVKIVKDKASLTMKDIDGHKIMFSYGVDNFSEDIAEKELEKVSK